MKKTAMLLVLVLVLGLAMAGCERAPAEEPVEEPTEVESSSPLVQSSRPAQSASEPAPPPEEEAVPIEPEPEDEADAPQAPEADSPPAPEAAREERGGTGAKLLIESMLSTFSLQYPFVTAKVESADITRVDLVKSSPADDVTVTLTDRAQIDALWEMMGRTEITTLGTDEINPATGGNLSLVFTFADGDTATITMVHIIWLNDNGPFLFVQESDEQLYWDLHEALL